MAGAEKAVQLLVLQQDSASRQQFGRASLVRSLYVAAVILATGGWLWLIASAAMKLL